MKVIFLDFDGVLLTLSDYVRLAKSGLSLDDLCPSKAVQNLFQELLARTNAKIVVSSSFRIGRTTAELETLLQSWGCSNGHVLGRTSDMKTRGEEIEEWLKQREHTHMDVDRFVILEDDVFDLGNMLPWVVKTEFEVGLTQRHVDEVVERLNDD